MKIETKPCPHLVTLGAKFTYLNHWQGLNKKDIVTTNRNFFTCIHRELLSFRKIGGVPYFTFLGMLSDMVKCYNFVGFELLFGFFMMTRYEVSLMH
jgi:hypothetical protein